MKILFFIDSLTAGGKERRSVELMKDIKSSSDTEFQLVLMNKEIHYKEVLNLNIKIYYLIRKAKKDISIFFKFYKICKAYKPDIIHCWDGMTAFYAIPVCKLLKIKLINGMVVDTPVVQNITNKYWLQGKLTFPFSNLVIGNSHSGLKAYKASLNRSVCIYNGMDFKRFEDLAPPRIIKEEMFGEKAQGLFIVGMVAAFENRKDYKTLIKAAITLISSHDNVRFILIGDGVNFYEIKNSVPHEYSNKIVFLGKKPDVETFVNIFDVGVLLTDTQFHGEGISNSIIEYMALSKPVIATKGGGTNEVVINNENGYLIDAFDDKQLIEKIEILLKDNTKRNSMGHKGFLMSKEKFNIKEMTDRYIQVYNNLIMQKKGQ